MSELDRAAVEMVWVAGKREDADRKLAHRVTQEMAVLPPARTTFVVVTSDCDFRHHFLAMHNAGYRVMVLHQATPGSDWERSLAMHCSEAFRWVEDVQGGLAAPPPSGTADASQDLSGERSVTFFVGVCQLSAE